MRMRKLDVHRWLSPGLALLLLAGPLPAALAGNDAWDEQGTWTLVTSNLVTHYRSDPDHNNRPALVGLEYNRPGDAWLVGGATFRNSFGQRSQYAYVGYRFDAGRWPVYAKVTGGVLQGYRGEYRDKIPFNRFGVAPAIVPAVGVQVNRFSTELMILGNSALGLNLNVDF